jgi:solute carrier family 35 protein E1
MLAAAASVRLSPASATAATTKLTFKPIHLPPLPNAGLRPLSLSARPLYRQEPFLAASRDDRAASMAPPAATADGARPVETAETARSAKIGVYFATWWALNVIFNIYNKKVLNAFPYPWLTSTLSLAAGSAIMLASWATRIAEAPQTDLDFWKALSPVSNPGPFLFFKKQSCTHCHAWFIGAAVFLRSVLMLCWGFSFVRWRLRTQSGTWRRR